jgi:cytochrome c oxidase cbb3-type subunit III
MRTTYVSSLGSLLVVVVVVVVAMLRYDIAAAQPPAFLINAYPKREVDPEAVARGGALYEEYACSFCHGPDTRGAAGGPSLLRSQLVQRDEAGETIGEVIRNGRPGTTMAAFPLTSAQISDIAEFLHSFELSSRDPARMRPETIVTGNPRAGRRYFDRHCSSCHSVEGDLAGIGSRYADPRELQQTWLMPSDAPPVRATITTAAGERVAGTLARIDEFIISLTLDDETTRTFQRAGDEPKVDLDDPLAGHKALLPRYEDSDIHDVTAYLVTIE